ncbi:MAG: endospore coat-associated protein [Candidatus Reconcilbacillus cellulovorans]|uniref:Endospore coat-associated protein n=1 Tax=Candidatus Reconcilbacillus cellulovorans TaxID=1906605 RepID=A0A2A6DY74_9BACL|nr:MAG: endospore coat-associated protein [Candidatus Reconcilbacillus cellulovorans]
MSGSRPTVGILTMHDEVCGFRGNRNNFVDLIRTGNRMGVRIVVVTERDYRPFAANITCHVYDEATGTWKTEQLPPPAVVYNRIPSRKDEAQPEVSKLIREVLRDKRVHLFNPFFFNKWTLYEWLGRSKTTRRYVPATCRLDGPRRLKSFLCRHASVYLKPVQGKAGKGIMKVFRIGDRAGASPKYGLIFQEEKRGSRCEATDFETVWERIRQIVGEEEYVLQQAVGLARRRDRPFDLRVLVQKNGRGVWSVTGIGARVAGKTSITTHVPRGGTIEKPEKLLAGVFGAANVRSLVGRVRKASLEIAAAIEKQSGYRLGEMSLDLGIDAGGRIWFFEANAKPMKFDEPHIRRKSLEHLVEYFLYLSKQTKMKKGGRPP